LYLIWNNTGAETVDHGFYNAFGFIGVIIIFVPILLFIFIIVNLIKEKNYKLLLLIAVIIILLIIIYNNLPGFSCEFWSLGLNNTRIENDKTKYPCEILHPGKNKCYLKKMDGFFDFSKIFRPSCSAEKILNKEKEIFLKSLSNRFFGVSKLNHFGYPITTVPNKYSMYNVKVLKEYQDLITHNIIKMDVFNEKNYPNEPYPEVELFFDEQNYGHIKMNIIFNETLSKERNEIAKTKKTLYDNVLIIYIDAISRNQFKRKLGKLANLIEPYMKYEKNYEKKKFSAFQFMKYNTVKGLTLPNIKAMFYEFNLKKK